jgi:hypothetical protein
MLTQAGRYVSGEQIFALIEKEEAPKALEQLSIALNVCTTFKETYATFKDTASAGTFYGFSCLRTSLCLCRHSHSFSLLIFLPFSRVPSQSLANPEQRFIRSPGAFHGPRGQLD